MELTVYLKLGFDDPGAWVIAGVLAIRKSQSRQSALCVVISEPSVVALGPTRMAVQPIFSLMSTYAYEEGHTRRAPKDASFIISPLV